MRFLTLLAVAVLTAVVAAQEPKKDKDFPPIPTVDLKRTAPVEYGADDRADLREQVLRLPHRQRDRRQVRHEHPREGA